MKQGNEAVCDVFRNVLSEEALVELRLQNLFRDSSRTCSPAELARILQERGLPVFESILEFEQKWGGVPVAPDKGGHYGTFASLPFYDSPWGRMRAEDLPAHDGRPLLPITIGNTSSFWMDREGVIYFVDLDVGECFPDASSSVVFFEQGALWGAKDRTAESSYRMTIRGRLGERVSAALELRRHALATDQYSGWWFGGGRWVVERWEYYRSYDPRRETIVQVVSQAEAAHALKAATDADSSVRVGWWGPPGAPPAPGEEIECEALSLEGAARVMVIASSTGRRVHLRKMPDGSVAE